MIPKFMNQYHPLTSRPFLRNMTYSEYLPCELLRPYVFCFWSSETSEESTADRQVRVIPDTCVDIIIDINYTRNTIRSRLCGIQDYTVMVEQKNEQEQCVRFAVRFYFWAVKRFLNLDMSCLYNQSLDFELLIPGCSFQFEELFYCNSLHERIAWMESYLLHRLNPEGYNSALYNSIDYLLRSKGGAPVREICGCSTISQRQLERLFKQEIGLSIKRTASLVRYQNVWREVIQQDTFNIQKAIGSYGYADQAHLLNEFKRFHGLWPSQAKQEALKSISNDFLS